MVYSLGVPRSSAPRLAEDLAQAYSLRDPRLMLRASEVSGFMSESGNSQFVGAAEALSLKH